MVKRKGLGRGLDTLLSSGAGRSPAKLADGSSVEQDRTIVEGILKDLPIESLQRGKYQPRRDMHPDSLEELAESIKAQGVMQAIVVRSVGHEQNTGQPKYEIIAGERRWRASQIAGLDKIPAIIREVPDEAAIAMSLIENIQREDLKPIEEALALKRLQDEFELTQQQVADAVGKSRTAVTNTLRLLSLKDEVRTLLEHGDLEMGHARCLLTLELAKQRSAARQIVAQGLSVRQAEALVRKMQAEENKVSNPPEARDSHIDKLEDRLGDHLGVPVSVQHSAKGKGKLVLKYNSLDELDGLLKHMQFNLDSH